MMTSNFITNVAKIVNTLDELQKLLPAMATDVSNNVINNITNIPHATLIHEIEDRLDRFSDDLEKIKANANRIPASPPVGVVPMFPSEPDYIYDTPLPHRVPTQPDASRVPPATV